MADAAEMLSGVNSHLFVVGFALLISWATIRLHYHQIANVLKLVGAGALRLPDNRFCGGSGLGRSGARDLHTVDAPHQR